MLLVLVIIVILEYGLASRYHPDDVDAGICTEQSPIDSDCINEEDD